MYTEVNKVPPIEGKPKILLGTGTGLGEAIVTKGTSDGYYVVYPGEGGHVDFAARNALEFGFMEFVK
jgi:glucokinase